MHYHFETYPNNKRICARPTDQNVEGLTSTIGVPFTILVIIFSRRLQLTQLMVHVLLTLTSVCRIAQY